MTIHYQGLPAMVNALEGARKDFKLWFAVDNAIQLPSASDLHFFDSQTDALDFQHFNKSMQKEVLLLPVEQTLDFIHDSMSVRLMAGEQYPNIIFDNEAILNAFEAYAFNYAVASFGETMDSFDWAVVSYDPLEANTEAESFNDKVQFNRLEHLIEELSGFALVGAKEKAFVAELTDRYWTGTPMESQCEAVLAGEYAKDFSTINNKTMNMENLQYLKDNVKYTGFGESLYPELEKNIAAKQPEFQLHFTTQVNNRPFDAVLDFRKSNTSDMYFFNRYTASIEKSNGQKVQQSFAINKGKGVTAKEAYNLLQGRAVKRELTNSKGETYQAWMQLDFTQKDDKGNHVVNKYNDNFGYDLREAVAKFPILELDGGEKEQALLRSLEKGNMQSVTINDNGAEQRIFIEANPHYKTLNVYDEHFKMLKHDDLPKVQRNESVRQEHNPAEKPTANRQEVKKANTQKNGNGLLTKKRVKQSKGPKIS